MPKVSDTFSKALIAVKGLDSSATANDRLKVVRSITGEAIDVDDLDVRDEFALFAVGRIRAWKSGGSFRNLADYLVVALAENSESQEESSSIALHALARESFDSQDLVIQSEVEIIVEVILQYYRETTSNIDLYPLHQLVIGAEGLTPGVKLKAIRVLLSGLDKRSNPKLLEIRQAIESLFHQESTQACSSDVFREVAKDLIDSFSIDEWAKWLPDLSFAKGSDDKFSLACKHFLGYCFDPTDPIFVLYFNHRQATGCEGVRLLKAKHLQVVRHNAQVHEIAQDLGKSLILNASYGYLENNFLDREVSATKVSREWIARQIEINKRDRKNVLFFESRNRNQ